VRNLLPFETTSVQNVVKHLKIRDFCGRITKFLCVDYNNNVAKVTLWSLDTAESPGGSILPLPPSSCNKNSTFYYQK
jgi:hypothetical protein